ncbi:hypothetical protein PSPO01_15549 [Paraphaeosphaeria sporulosa]
MGSDNHSSSSSTQNTTNIINVSNNYNAPPDRPQPPRPFINSLLQWLISGYNAEGGSSAPVPTGDPQKDLKEMKTLLHDWAATLFYQAFSYTYNGASSAPPGRVTTGSPSSMFISMEDFTNCPSINRASMTQYIDTYVFPSAGLPVSGYNITTLQNDMVGVLTPLMQGSPIKSWNTTTYKRGFASTDGSKELGVNAIFIWTVVNATDGNGDAQPWFFCYYLGGYYDEVTL